MAVRHDLICSVGECEYFILDELVDVDSPESFPRHCDRPMEIWFNNLRPGIAEFTPFVTKNIHPDGKPLLVRNRGDLQRYYKEYGVVHVDDPELVAIGNEIRKAPKSIGKVFDMGGR